MSPSDYEGIDMVVDTEVLTGGTNGMPSPGDVHSPRVVSPAQQWWPAQGAHLQAAIATPRVGVAMNVSTPYAMQSPPPGMAADGLAAPVDDSPPSDSTRIARLEHELAMKNWELAYMQQTMQRTVASLQQSLAVSIDKIKQLEEQAAATRRESEKHKTNSQRNPGRVLKGERCAFKGTGSPIPMITRDKDKKDDRAVAVLETFLEITKDSPGFQQRLKVIDDLNYRLWDGMYMRIQHVKFAQNTRIDPYEIVKQITLDPGALNDSAIDAIRRCERHKDNARTTIPPSSTVSRVRMAMDAAVARHLGRDITGVRVDGDTWRYNDVGALLAAIFDAVDLPPIDSAEHPLTIAFSFDGTNVTNDLSYLNVGLKLSDPRLSAFVRKTPQSKSNVVPLGGSFNPEKRLLIVSLVVPLLNEVRELGRRGVHVDSGTVHFDVTVAADMKALWGLFDEVGGSMGVATHPDIWTPCNAELKSIGMPFGCNRPECGENCLHWIYSAEHAERVAARSAEVAEDLAAKLGTCSSLNHVMPIMLKQSQAVAKCIKLCRLNGRDLPLEKNMTKATAEAVLKEVCPVTMPSHGGSDAQELVDEMADDQVRGTFEQLEADLDHVAASQPLSLRELLPEVLKQLDVLRRSEAYLSYPANDGPVSAENCCPDSLHCMLRAIPTVVRAFLCFLFQIIGIPTGQNRGKYIDRIRTVIEKKIRQLSGVTSFSITFVDGTKTEVVPQTLKAGQLYAVLEVLGRLDETNPLYVPLGDKPDVRDKLIGMAHELHAGIAVMRRMPDLIPGQVGYQEQLLIDADEMQRHFDMFWINAKATVGDRVLTNYGSLIKNGTFHWAFLKFGYPIRIAQDSYEAFMKEVVHVYHRHSQMGGSQGENDGARTQVLADTLCRAFARTLAYTTNLEQTIVEEAKRKRAEDLPVKVQRLLQNRLTYRRQKRENDKLFVRRQGKENKRKRDATRNNEDQSQKKSRTGNAGQPAVRSQLPPPLR